MLAVVPPMPDYMKVRFLIFAVSVVAAWVLTGIVIQRLRPLYRRLKRVRMVGARVTARRALDPDLPSAPYAQGAYGIVSFALNVKYAELSASDAVYHKCREGCKGLLTYRGDTVIDFKPLI